jgi:hypothetical protein
MFMIVSEVLQPQSRMKLFKTTKLILDRFPYEIANHDLGPML